MEGVGTCGVCVFVFVFVFVCARAPQCRREECAKVALLRRVCGMWCSMPHPMPWQMRAEMIQADISVYWWCGMSSVAAQQKRMKLCE